MFCKRNIYCHKIRNKDILSSSIQLHNKEDTMKNPRMFMALSGRSQLVKKH